MEEEDLLEAARRRTSGKTFSAFLAGKDDGETREKENKENEGGLPRKEIAGASFSGESKDVLGNC